MSGLLLAGYAAVFDVTDKGGDVIRPGAFADSLAGGREIPLLWQHRPDAVIGQATHLAEDARGLRVIARIAEGRAAQMLRQRQVTGLSFGYRVRAAKGAGPRELSALDLIEISLVTRPMQPLARVHFIA